MSTVNENLFGYNRPSKQIELMAAFREIEGQLERMSESLAMHSGRPADSFRADRAQALVIAAKRLLEGNPTDAQSALEMAFLPLV